MKNLIKQTLGDGFNLDNFITFAKNFFNEIEIKPQELIVSKGLEGHIKNFTFLGEFSDAEKKNIDVLAVELAADTKVERARSLQRNIVAKYLKDNTKDAGLVAFYSKNNPDWRLSFVKVDYKFTERGVKVEVGTPPKRYSFLVGETEPSHTAQKQLLPILEDQKHNPLVSQIEDAFSVEKVTKEFYEKYRGLFESLSKDLKKNKSFQIIATKENIDIENFAKKLLGQIVFLYFLQKKGWLGVPRDKTWGQGDKFFLRTLFDKAKKEKKNFYNDYLEPLFYDTLNNPRRDEVDPAYSRYFDCKIPFLNGGLFECDYDWKNTIVYLVNDIFEDIIDTFDLYNFTVKEDEPLEKEVAVDPEMLGKVFENLLPENLRKGQGAYYTPREIVHYMCQESLINCLANETKVDIEKVRKLVTFKDSIITKEDYFETINNDDTRYKIAREKILTLWENETELFNRVLANIKVCDPACGSGAFLVGMLNEIVGARRILNSNKSEYQLKKETIQNCIYGVDIDPGAVEIAKLRLWLSLVVDYELKDIEPLPNLDYKIICGNSLLEELVIGEESIKLFDEKLLTVSQATKETKNGLFEYREMEGKTPAQNNEYLENLLKDKQKKFLELHSKNQLSREKREELEKEIAAINKELNQKPKRTKVIDSHPTFFDEKAERYFNTLRELHKQYFYEYDPTKKAEKRRQIESIELEFIKSSIKEKADDIETRIKNLNMQDPDDRKKLAELTKKKLEYLAIPNEIHRSKVRPYFLWKLNFFEVFQEKGGFDVVIANPPYVKKENLSSQIINQLEQMFLEIKDGKEERWSDDLYVHFIFKGLELVRKSGIMTYITNDSFIGLASKERVRRLLLQRNLIKLIKCPKETFEAMIYTAVFILRKEEPIDKQYESGVFEYPSFSYQKIGPVLYDTIYTLPDLRLVFSSPIFSIFSKFINYPKVKEYFDILDTGIHSGNVREKIFFKEKVKANLVRLLQGKQIKKYGIFWDSEESKYKYCDIHYVPKKTKGVGRKGKISKHEEYWHFCGDIKNHHQPERLLMRQSDDDLIVAYHSEREMGQFYTDNTLFTILPNKKAKDEKISLKYVLALLNSHLLNTFYHFLSQEEGKTLAQVKVGLVNELPFIINNHKTIIEIVDKIINLTGSKNYPEDTTKQNKVLEYETQLDQLIYKIYGLTEKEIVEVEKIKEI